MHADAVAPYVYNINLKITFPFCLTLLHHITISFTTQCLLDCSLPVYVYMWFFTVIIRNVCLFWFLIREFFRIKGFSKRVWCILMKHLLYIYFQFKYLVWIYQIARNCIRHVPITSISSHGKIKYICFNYVDWGKLKYSADSINWGHWHQWKINFISLKLDHSKCTRSE